MPSRYLIGIDLGTTNSVVAYVDAEDEANIGVFNVPQLVGPGEVRDLPALPSFLYFPTPEELSAGGLSLPWNEQPQGIAGAMAREQGALVPRRQVSSAKSWLSNARVDRRAHILPADADPAAVLVSPVEASARYLIHLRDAWNHVIAGDAPTSRFEKQQIVLTVPASFDEEARELTVEAARLAGLEDFRLLEEPLAAFYSWIDAHREQLQQQLRDGDLVLICDIGGGTSDFSLVRAHIEGDDVQFERTAIGEHLLLGGDNLDLALARRVEQSLNTRLNLRQRQALRRACCAAKERLLAEPMVDCVPINILGTGRAVVGQMLTGELRRADVIELLTSGFLPLTGATEMPSRARSAGLRELGLPYASDPAITKHLAAFLMQAAAAMQGRAPTRGRMVRPDAILFNGGFCVPAVTRERIAEAIGGWFRETGEQWQPRILPGAALESAVARGAAYYARVRRGVGMRIRAGSARSYYVGLRSEEGLRGVCVLPFGVEEGTTLPLENRDFTVLANRPVSFTLYSSRTRHDAHGEVVTLDPEVHRHAPLVTLLRYGKKLREVELAVRLRVSFTEVGTLELWCESLSSPHRWRLQFELRGDQPEAQPAVESRAQQSSRAIMPAAAPTLDESIRLIRAVFAKPAAEEVSPETLVTALEKGLAMKRDAWPLDLIRSFADVLLQLAEGRRQSPRHEVRWLNLLGFCLRPGFGAPRDDGRINLVRRIASAGPAFPRDIPCESEWLVLWRRIAGGVHAGVQQEIYRKQAPLLGIVGAKKKLRLNPQIEYEGWRLLASLEHLPPGVRTSLGKQVIARITDDPDDTRWLWALARLGARIPLYGPLPSVVPASAIAEWLNAVLDLPELTGETAYCVVQLARRTDDPQRDVDDGLRKRVIATLRDAGLAEENIPVLQKYIPPQRVDAERMMGESLPSGLRLVSSANCLLSVTALTSDPDKVA